MCHVFHDSSGAKVLFSYQPFNFFSEGVALPRITTCKEQELSFRIIATFPRYIMRKVWIRVLWILHFVIYFSLEEVLQGLLKNNTTKKQIDADIQLTMKNCTSSETYWGENVLQVIATNIVFHKVCYLDYLLLLLLYSWNTC